jgi:hypothetical protein
MNVSVWITRRKILTGQNLSTRSKINVLQPFYAPQVSHWLACNWTRASVVGGRVLTAWAMESEVTAIWSSAGDVRGGYRQHRRWALVSARRCHNTHSSDSVACLRAMLHVLVTSPGQPRLLTSLRPTIFPGKKVKFTLKAAMKAQRERKGIPLLFL